MANANAAIPRWEQAWRDWVKDGFAVDIGLNYLAGHKPDPTYWQPRTSARTLGRTAVSDQPVAAPRWRVASFRRNQVLLYEAKDGSPLRLNVIEFVSEAVRDADRMAFTAP
jgi:hypothetical protein